MYARAREKTNACTREMIWEKRRPRAERIRQEALRHQKTAPSSKKTITSLLLRFFSYTVSPTSEIVFSTSEVDFPTSEFFSVVVVGGRISATLSIPIFAPSGDALFGVEPSVGSSSFVLLAYG